MNLCIFQLESQKEEKECERSIMNELPFIDEEIETDHSPNKTTENKNDKNI